MNNEVKNASNINDNENNVKMTDGNCYKSVRRYYQNEETRLVKTGRKNKEIRLVVIRPLITRYQIISLVPYDMI